MPEPVVEEGECVMEIRQASGKSRYDQIVHMIEQSEQMKSAAESKAANLADKLVPYTFAGSFLSFVLTRNLARSLSVLMVDFSCALKLAMPLAVLSAMREAEEPISPLRAVNSLRQWLLLIPLYLTKLVR